MFQPKIQLKKRIPLHAFLYCYKIQLLQIFIKPIWFIIHGYFEFHWLVQERNSYVVWWYKQKKFKCIYSLFQLMKFKIYSFKSCLEMLGKGSYYYDCNLHCYLTWNSGRFQTKDIDANSRRTMGIGFAEF